MKNEQELIAQIKHNLDTGKVSEAELATDERVLARITDGIYRQPSSALRELITNAYDADATRVHIQTDAPRFSRISIRDDGNGLSIEALASLIKHIGGSPKRTRGGIKLGVVNRADPSLSPGGRRLIGKIGIGLFSVAQLTRHFQIITKTKGSNHRLVAEITLKIYSEDDLSTITDSSASFEAGTVRIQAVPATDKSTHGTEIILLDLRQQTKDLLQSKVTWLHADSGHSATEIAVGPPPPKYHIGVLKKGSTELLKIPPHLPWTSADPPETRFARLYQAIVEEVGAGENPKLENLLDNYLRTLWTLSMSAPIDYIDKHPFDLGSDDVMDYYHVSNMSKGQSSAVQLKEGETLRSKLALKAPERGAAMPFHVYVDEVELRRPMRFHDLPPTTHAIATPMLFVGQCSPDLSSVPKEIRGGDLSFEAYFLWAPKIVPKENNGVLIRISDASGTLFDESFMKYQISEQTRLRQITAEIFILKGLDAALNIDRESFNYAHPHFQYLTKWVHSALRQLANTHKQAAADVRTVRDTVVQSERSERLQRTVAEELKQAGKDPVTEITEVVFATGGGESLKQSRSKGALAFDSNVVFSPLSAQSGLSSAKKKKTLALYEERMKAVAKILEAYGVLEDLPNKKQQQLLRAIVAVFSIGE